MNADAQIRADMVEARLQLWFFRDLTDEQRMKLIGLVFYPALKVDTAMTMNQQAKLLEKIVEQLRGTT